MSAAHQHLNPSDLTDDQLKLFAFALAGKIPELMNEPMTRKEAAAFTKYGIRTFDRLVSEGKFRSRKPYKDAAPRFIPSELVEDMKHWNS